MSDSYEYSEGCVQYHKSKLPSSKSEPKLKKAPNVTIGPAINDSPKITESDSDRKLDPHILNGEITFLHIPYFVHTKPDDCSFHAVTL